MIKEQPDIGIVAMCGAFASFVFGPEAAVFVGPYIVIILASTVGASFALGRRETSARNSAIWFFLRVNALATILTVALATIVSGTYPTLHERVLIAPIAFVVGFIGDDWPAILRWVGKKINAFVDVLIKLKGGGNG